MPTREQIAAALRGAGDYAGVAARWRVPPGLVYLIATGRPADGSGGYDGRAQALVNPREVNPTGRGDVLAWMRRRAWTDASMRSGR